MEKRTTGSIETVRGANGPNDVVDSVGRARNLPPAGAQDIAETQKGQWMEKGKFSGSSKMAFRY